jgi:sugar phosphate isomerase/epimerase
VRLGVGSYAFGWATEHGIPRVDEQWVLAFARRHAVPVAQIADNIPLHAASAERVSAFVEAAADAGIAIELGARGLREEHLATYLDLCRQCGATLLRFVVDEAGYEPTAADLLALLRNAVPALRAAGVTLAIENHDRFGAASLRDIIDAAGSPSVGACLDTANSLGAGEGLDHVVRHLAPVTVNLHVKDVRIRRVPYLQGFVVEGCALGEGRLPIAEAIARIRAEGRCGTAVLEAWNPPLETMADTVASELDAAERSVAVLEGMLRAVG